MHAKGSLRSTDSKQHACALSRYFMISTSSDGGLVLSARPMLSMIFFVVSDLFCLKLLFIFSLNDGACVHIEKT